MDEKYHFAKELVAEAGAFLRQHLYDDLQIEAKTDFTDLVTHLDRQVQADMTQKILSRYPDDIIYGEESVNLQPLNQGAVWVIDPIDGTNNFVAQKTDFAVILAYLEEDRDSLVLSTMSCRISFIMVAVPIQSVSIRTFFPSMRTSPSIRG